MKTPVNALLRPLAVAVAVSLAGAAVSLPAAAADNTYTEVTSVGQYAGWRDPGGRLGCADRRALKAPLKE